MDPYTFLPYKDLIQIAVESSIDLGALASKWSWQKRTMEAWPSTIFTWIKGKAPMLAMYW